MGVTGDDPNGASSTSLRDALLDRISNCDKATVKRGFDDNVRRMPLLLVDGEFLSDSYELEFNQYFEFAACWKRAYARFRDELLNGEIFYTLKEAQIIIEQWRRHYNTQRPHSALGYRPPAPEAIIPIDQRPAMH